MSQPYSIQDNIKLIVGLTNPQLQLEPDVHGTIKQLLSPWIETTAKLESVDQLNLFMNTYLPEDIRKVVQHHLSELIDVNGLKGPTKPVTLDQQKNRLIDVLLGVILEVAADNAQECFSMVIDTHDIYVGIQNHPGLMHMFGQYIPPFQYSDNLSIETILEMLRPDLKTTRGCRIALNNYISTLIGLTANYNLAMIDQLTNQFSVELSPSQSRIDAIRRLKISIVKYCLQNIPADHPFSSLTFMDIVQAINTMNLVVTLRAIGSSTQAIHEPIVTIPYTSYPSYLSQHQPQAQPNK